jgi:hypothetical protein
MTHAVVYNPGVGIIETTAQGTLSESEAKEIILEIAQLGKEKNCFLCLSDDREAALDMSTLQIHDLPEVLTNMVNSLGLRPGQFKRAIVVKQSFPDYRFFETVTLNAGQNIRLFQDREEAKKWLLQA